MRTSEIEKTKTRLIWIDLIRIIATWGVISIHGKSCYTFETGTVKYLEYGIIGNAFTFCVPVFLLLSGYLSLNKNVTVKETLLRRVPRVVLMKVVSIILCAFAGGIIAILRSQPLLDAIENAVGGWGFGTSYLSVLLGCYLVTPLLCKFTNDRKLEEYFLVLSVIFCFVVPTFTDLDYIRNAMPKYITKTMEWLDYGQVYLPVGSASLFVLGHYLGEVSKKLSKKGAYVFLFLSFTIWELASLFSEKSSVISALRYGRYYGSYVAPLITIYSSC